MRNNSRSRSLARMSSRSSTTLGGFIDRSASAQGIARRDLKFESLEARLLLSVDLATRGDWVAQGPGPTLAGQVEWSHILVTLISSTWAVSTVAFGKQITRRRQVQSGRRLRTISHRCPLVHWSLTRPIPLTRRWLLALVDTVVLIRQVPRKVGI